MLQPAENPLLSETQIEEIVDRVAARIAEDYRGASIMMVGLLTGAFVFMADLARALSRYGVRIEEVDFIIASSYEGTESSRNVQILRDLRTDVQGRNILLVDDILDTGNTLLKIRRLLETREPSRLACCCLLDKPSRREVELDVEYIGLEIEDRFVIGYGLDYNQDYRALPYITEMVEK
ncbi:hypoxanthine phosphoribosyltransferase [bacterium]|nr:hypoxanthine phosphoribosyltransferase [bacterium]